MNISNPIQIIATSQTAWMPEILTVGASYRQSRYSKYEHFCKFIQAKYPDSRRILDVGTGYGESSIILSKQGYEMTAMDHFLEEELKKYESNNINVINSYFDLETNIDEYDLIIGLHCCGAIEPIIRKCLEKDKEFVVTLCELRQGMYGQSICTRKQYVDYLKGLSDGLKMTVLPIYESLTLEHWGETIYYKKELKK